VIAALAISPATPFCLAHVPPITPVVERLDSDSIATLSPEETHKERMSLVWIPATLSVGLLIAAAYLGSRILTAQHATGVKIKIAAPVTSVPTAPVPAAMVQADPQPKAPSVQPEAAAPPPELPKLAADEQIPMIDPQAGERYIQVSALTEEAARRYIRELRQAKFEPHIAPGPRPELMRVLIGPFADQDALALAQSDLARAGITNFVRRY
jgi:cell division septation protein DedD